MVTLVVTGDGTGSFQTVNFDLFNLYKFVTPFILVLKLLCITLVASSKKSD